jgi:prepilin-type processing-associated H-X9-DG protein
MSARPFANIWIAASLRTALPGRGATIAHADGHAQNVAHEFHNATVGAVADQREGQNDLMQPLFGDWKGK